MANIPTPQANSKPTHYCVKGEEESELTATVFPLRSLEASMTILCCQAPVAFFLFLCPLLLCMHIFSSHVKQGQHIAVLNDNPAILQPKQKNNNILLNEKNKTLENFCACKRLD
jgi:hypothetical protein